MEPFGTESVAAHRIRCVSARQDPSRSGIAGRCRKILVDLAGFALKLVLRVLIALVK
jgi:hypothetical protein